MVERKKKKKKKKKGTISEDDTLLLIQRYSATTIVSLLQGVSQFADVTIDWNALVKRSSTGISNPREYQMLWRHLAYREPLLEKIDGAEPTDDDSDLEFELEAVPAVSAEVSSQAAACVKVLMHSSLPSSSGQTNDSAVEAPTVDTSNGQALNTTPDKEQPARSACGKNITSPVSLHKQLVLTGPFPEGLDGNETAGSGSAMKKKRKLWTKEEDTELIAAVQKHGEGNWASILKGDFKHNRTASQLSQRWSTLKKRLSHSNPGGGSNSSRSTQSEALLATRKAVANALRMPMVGSLSAIHTGATQSTPPSNTSTFPSTVSEATPAPPPQASNPLRQTSHQAAYQKGALTPSNKPQITPKNPPAPVQPSVSPNPLIQAAAFAAGGRIAAPSAAASLLKAAQSKNVVHIIPGGAKLMSTANKGRPQSSFRQTRPFMMPPLPGNTAMALNGTKVGSHRGRGSSTSLTGQSSASLAQLSCSSQGNAEKMSGKEISTTDGDGGLLTEGVEGGDEMELDGAVGQDQKEALDVGENNSNMSKDADNSEAMKSENS